MTLAELRLLLNECCLYTSVQSSFSFVWATQIDSASTPYPTVPSLLCDFVLIDGTSGFVRVQQSAESSLFVHQLPTLSAIVIDIQSCPAARHCTRCSQGFMLPCRSGMKIDRSFEGKLVFDVSAAHSHGSRHGYNAAQIKEVAVRLSMTRQYAEQECCVFCRTMSALQHNQQQLLQLMPGKLLM
eukprot:TRINITY_DN2701_c0_g2_i1.p1 TRINITY_DN2701_c0_g2~~TRINITY_DN2701_c0_g2_i1.p1  ORF type:complete len:184 (-),score=23.27 TRINITY_DN2701_c0_g2_i1:211-762(-)